MASAADKLPAGFIAVSEFEMNWNDAKAFCKQKGGRLPRINGKDSLARADVGKNTHIDGFGALGVLWPSGIPQAVYWTDTVDFDGPGGPFFVSVFFDGPGPGPLVTLSAGDDQRSPYRVACVR